MRVGILYIALGAYDSFFEGFYRSCEAFFLPNSEKEYFVFTDSTKEIFYNNPKIHRIQQESMGWPDNTMQRFRLFCSIEDTLREFDYLFFFNANIVFVKTIDESVLPSRGIIVVQHPGYTTETNCDHFSYDRNPLSKAYIPYGEGEIYICGGVNGGTSEAYLHMARELKKRTDTDTENGVVAKAHDESQLNRYILDIPKSEYVVWDFGYAYPDTYKPSSVEKKAVILTKENYIPLYTLRDERGALARLVVMMTYRAPLRATAWQCRNMYGVLSDKHAIMEAASDTHPLFRPGFWLASKGYVEIGVFYTYMIASVFRLRDIMKENLRRDRAA